jgi:hypothetical protein
MFTLTPYALRLTVFISLLPEPQVLFFEEKKEDERERGHLRVEPPAGKLLY